LKQIPKHIQSASPACRYKYHPSFQSFPSLQAFLPFLSSLLLQTQPSRSFCAIMFAPVVPLLASFASFFAAAAHASVVFTVSCDPLSIQMADPIVSPGVASGHVHAISGGTAFNRTMLGADGAVDAKATTCDKFTDHSNYVRRS
jgi:Domain of unknown function (DUF1996)